MKQRIFQILWLVTSLALTGSVQAGTRVVHLHGDHLGSPSVGTDQAGEVLWREHYRPYGERINYSDNSDTLLGFTGHAEDAETGLVYMQARYYSPQLGRFLAIDPAGPTSGNVQSFNRYSYANDNPYNYVDPDGKNALAIGALVVISLAVLYSAIHATQETTRIIRENPGVSVIPVVYKEKSTPADAENSPDEPTPAEAPSKDKKRKYTKKDREKMYENANGTCEYCGEEVTMEPGTGKSMEGDHIDPWANGGPTNEENGASACRDCNRGKSKKRLGDGKYEYKPKAPNSRIRDKMRRY